MSIKVDQAFINTMLNGGIGIDIVHENGAYSTWNGSDYVTSLGVYTPSAQREFAEIRTFPAGQSALSLNESDEAVGLFQCILKYPADIGSITIKTKAEQVLSLFKVATLLTYSGQQVEIVSHSRDGGRNEGGYYQIVIRANYRAFIAR